MFLQLLQSGLIIIGLFAGSISTAYYICEIKKLPFINPLYHKDQNVRNKYYSQITQTLPPVFIATTLLFNHSSQYFTQNKMNAMQTGIYIILYCVIIEFAYYIYHRIIHHKSLYKSIHSKHHENTIIYPMDSIYVGSVDIFLYITCLHIPIYILRVDLFIYCICVYIYVLLGFISHSSILYNHHVIHHKLFRYNYCLVIPMFDLLFDTYREHL
uniref:Fatty acid hydroxylase domain-containing protein n=1 Tax=viral metagenome TaxID=1070528 RepID=A0A6C0LS74_9ZZZZ